ncbi:hypothetical protein F5B21DRAFT_525068 [Xylaria acuta]|nr:hypothetical protein F5B21DRAFT_525068 [Xylaria acuta]
MATRSRTRVRAKPVIEPTDKLKFLADISHDDPHRWICEICLRGHRIYPVTILRMDFDEYLFSSCPQIQEFNAMTYGDPGFRVDPRLRKLDHRHVQLALKWTRLRNMAYKPILDQIMRSSNWAKLPTTKPEPPIEYRTTPKIVLSKDKLKFLLRSEWRFPQIGWVQAEHGIVGDTRICPHIYAIGRGPSYRGGTPLDVSVLKSRDNHTKLGQSETEFKCEFCATDYSISWGDDKWLLLTSWQDFGPETSPTDLLWRSHCIDGLVPVIHSRGMIRRMYEKQPAVTYGPTLMDGSSTKLSLDYILNSRQNT